MSALALLLWSLQFPSDFDVTAADWEPAPVCIEYCEDLR